MKTDTFLKKRKNQRKLPDQRFKQLSQEEILLAKAIPAIFIESVCTVLNPYLDPQIQSFKLWDYQRDYLEVLDYCIHNKIGNHNDKSREMGFSWLYMAYFMWGVSWYPGFSALTLCMRGSDVDDGGTNSSPKSLFGRVRWMWNQIPDGHPLKAPLIFRLRGIYNSDYGDRYIYGETANADAGRGGRFLIGLWDECAHTAVDDEEIWSSFSRAVHTPILNSTPRGEENTFYRLKYSPGMIKTSHHWSRNPIYSKGMWKDEATGKLRSPWYDKACEGLLPWQIARELDIIYAYSQSSLVFNDFNEKIHVAEGDIQYNPRLPLYRSWDFGIGDPTVILWIQVTPDDCVLVIDMYSNSDQITDHYAEVALSRYRGTAVDTDYGDPRGANRGARFESHIGILKTYGINVKTKENVRILDKINLIRRWLKPVIIDGKEYGKIILSRFKCKEAIEMMRSLRWPTDSNGDIKADSEPVRDKHIHAADSLGYFFVNKFSMENAGWPDAILTPEDYTIMSRMKSIQSDEWAFGGTLIGENFLQRKF